MKRLLSLRIYDITQGVTSVLTRVEYWYDKETPDNTGWYICHFDDVNAMLAKSPYDTIGPYDTEGEAKRVLAETTDLDKDENSTSRKIYDPSRDPAPTLDAGIPTDNDEVDPSEGVQLELQQAEELRDVPTEVQGD
jgi:hypothetical protein